MIPAAFYAAGIFLIHRLMKISIYKTIVCLLALLHIHLVHAQNAAYPLNDPRNPDCPCHKLQKQAEDEYAQQNKSALPESNLQNVPAISRENNESGSVLRTKTGSAAIVKKRRKRSGRWDDVKFRYLKKRSKAKKMRPDYSVCFRW